MTTLEIPGYADQSPATNSVTSGLLDIVASIKRWHARRRALAQLAHLDPHMQRDVGVELQDRNYALSGSAAAVWAELCVHPVVAR